MKTKQPTAIDLFCGCGGLTLGLKQAGFAVLAGLDSDPLAVATYRLNHPGTQVWQADIRRIRPDRIRRQLKLRLGELDLLAGCPPCQAFSTLRTLNGKKKIKDPLRDLVMEFVKFIKALRPKTLMIENVPGLAMDSTIRRFGRALIRLGYRYQIEIFDAADFGVPQRRQRMILIAGRRRTIEFAQPAIRRPTVRDAIGKLPSTGLSGDPLHDYHPSRSPRIEKLIQKIPKDGGSRHDLPVEQQLHCHRKIRGFYDVYGRMEWSKPAPTITSGCINPSKGRFLHPVENRAITLREAALLQGFPKEYEFSLERGIYPAAQLIGNAFPPAFAEMHARVLRSQIKRKR